MYIASDKQPPFTEIVFPKNQDKFEAGSTLSVKTYSYDAKSDINKVVFYLGDKLVGTVSKAPYDLNLVLPSSSQKTELKVVAFDQAANMAEDSIQIVITKFSQTDSNIVKIISPQNNTKIKLADSLLVSFEVPASKIDNLSQVDLIEQDLESKKMEIITTINNFTESPNGKYFAVWASSKKGKFYFFVRTKNQQSKISLSEKITVIVE